MKESNANSLKLKEAVQSISTQDEVAQSQKNNHQQLLCIWNILALAVKELELVGAKQSSTISILSKNLQPKDVDLKLWIWIVDGSFSILVLILVCLLKRVWEFLQAPGCQIGFLRNHGSACSSSR